jgi:hypothetical protein
MVKSRHIANIKNLYDEDRKKNLNSVYLPDTLEKKYRNAGKEWAWFWLSPSKALWIKECRLYNQ